MTVVTRTISIETKAHPTFIDVTAEVERLVSESPISCGVAVVSSQHTTCSVLIQERSESHTTFNGTEYLMQDLVNVLETVIPTCRSVGQYLHPGPDFVASAPQRPDDDLLWALNTDAHLRSIVLGRSETIPVHDGRLQLGEFGRIYFADFDQVRARRRTAWVTLLGE
jgi:thiamine phosphate synthase YjbQ (UPF0047 family)